MSDQIRKAIKIEREHLIKLLRIRIDPLKEYESITSEEIFEVIEDWIKTRELETNVRYGK
ncbi:hypothetical protein [Trabulsiella odontotermitis]|uniref:hypothetical protein n=1 Tax=Trabulsiella odontotermitis TaxID=379893 RepID=UPI0006760570|nr:hypothetical protein [Trabulsiella odontotermitis]